MRSLTIAFVLLVSALHAWELQDIADVQLSKDNQHIIYSIGDAPQSKLCHTIWISDARGSDARPFAKGHSPQ